MEYYLTIKGKKILLFVKTWENLESIMINEISQMKKTNTVCSHLYGESKITQTPRKREWIGGFQRWGLRGGWEKHVKVVKRYTLPVIR